MRVERVSGVREALNSVFTLRTKLKTLSLSAFEAGMARSSKAKVARRTYFGSSIGDLVQPSKRQVHHDSLTPQM